MRVSSVPHRVVLGHRRKDPVASRLQYSTGGQLVALPTTPSSEKRCRVAVLGQACQLTRHDCRKNPISRSFITACRNPPLPGAAVYAVRIRILKRCSVFRRPRSPVLTRTAGPSDRLFGRLVTFYRTGRIRIFACVAEFNGWLHAAIEINI